MSTLTVELPAELVTRLEIEAGHVPEAKARLVREALERLFADRGEQERRPVPGSPVPEPFPDGQTFGDLMKDLCGKYEGPGDLSYNPKYMEGFGEE